MRVVFLEYAWDMGWCDPCAADPLSSRELQDLGVFWIVEADSPAPGGRPRGVRRDPRRRTSSSRACTCATTAHISRRISCSRRPAIARTSRAVTSCGIRGRDRIPARPRTTTAARCQRDSIAKPTRCRRLQGGGWKRSGSGRELRQWQPAKTRPGGGASGDRNRETSSRTSRTREGRRWTKKCGAPGRCGDAESADSVGADPRAAHPAVCAHWKRSGTAVAPRQGMADIRPGSTDGRRLRSSRSGLSRRCRTTRSLESSVANCCRSGHRRRGKLSRRQTRQSGRSELPN